MPMRLELPAQAKSLASAVNAYQRKHGLPIRACRYCPPVRTKRPFSARKGYLLTAGHNTGEKRIKNITLAVSGGNEALKYDN